MIMIRLTEPVSVDRLLVALQRRLPQHSAAQLLQFVRMAQIDAREAYELARFLDRHEDALTRPRSAVPAAFPPLAHVLSVSAGAVVAKPTCSGCGRATFFLPHGTPEGRWCSSCAARQRPCARCGSVGAARKVTAQGHFCSACLRRSRLEPCSICGKVCRVSARWPRGAVGDCCRLKVIQARTPCSACGRVLPLIGRDANGALRCGPCVGSPLDFACRCCGRTGDNHGATSCRRCALAARTTVLLTSPDGTVAEQWQLLQEHLATTTTPATVLNWIATAPAARILRELVLRGTPVTHTMLDALSPSSSVHYLRDLLVRSSTLPNRDGEYLHRIEPWLRELLADAPPHHTLLLAPFARWYLLPKARRSARRRGVGESAATTIPSSVLAASRLLTWLDTLHISLSGLTQSHVDEWLDTGRGHYRYVYPFIAWASKHQLIEGDIRVPVPQYPQKLRHLSTGERTAQLRRCLDDNEMPLHLRVAATFTILFGFPITATVRLRRNDILTDHDTTFLRVGSHQLALPPRLATLVHELATQSPPTGSGLGLAVPMSTLLFPGRSSQRPLAPSDLYRQLAAHDISILPARNCARLALATELPAPVLAGLTGIEIATAVAWNARVGHDWTAFVAARVSSTATWRAQRA
jgi:hypothetical protein